MKNTGFVTGVYKLSIYFIDVILILLSIFLAFMYKFDFNPPRINYEPVLSILPLIVLSYLIFMYVFGLNDILKQSLGEMVYSTFLIIFSLTVITVFITFFDRGFAYPRSVIIVSSLWQLLLLILWRSIVWKMKRVRHGIKDSLVIGNSAAEYLSKKILLKQSDLYRVKYICDPKCDNLDDYLKDVCVVFICNDVELSDKCFIVDNCLSDRKSVYIVPDIYEISLLNSKLNKADDIPMLKVQKLGLTLEQKIIKRFLDIVVSLVGLVAASPFMLFAAMAIKLTDGGNVFYTQKRVTIHEKTFGVLKFRTMIMNAEKLTGPTLAGEDDPRITKIGRIMRSTRIDELPQLINVLKGDMSIVGPRPERPFFAEQYTKDIAEYKYRTIVKAGLTGLAQVLGKYTTTAEDKVRYDMIYIKNYSVLLDLKLILQTIKIMFMRESSAGKKDEVALVELVGELNLDVVIDTGVNLKNCPEK